MHPHEKAKHTGAGSDRTPARKPESASPAQLRGLLGLQASAGNAAVVQMLGQAGHPWIQEQHQHSAGCGHQQTEPAQQPAVQRSTVHDVRAQVADRRRPEAPARAMNATPPAVRAHAPLTPQGAPALQRTVGNQAAIVVSRMPQPQQQQQQEAPQQGGGDTGGYLHGWLVWFFAWFAWFTRNAQRQAPVAVEAAPVAEPTPPPVAAPKAAAEEAPPPTTAPMVTAKEQPVISEYEHVELRTKFRKLSSTRDEMNAKLQTRLDELSEEIEPLLKQGAVVRVDKLEKVEHEIKNIYRAMEKAPASQPRAGESSTEPAVTNAEGQRPVEIQYGTKIGSSPAGWGPYGDVVERVIKDMRDGRVTLGPDFKPHLGGLSVTAHWQQGDPQHFIKVYLDEKDVGKGTRVRGYFRYKVSAGRLVIKFVAIRKEHAGGGQGTLILGDSTELVSETES